MTTVSRAALAPGETTIDRAKITKADNGNREIRFTVCHHDGRKQRVTKQAPPRTPAVDLRRMAREKAEQLLNQSSSTVVHGGIRMSDYIKSQTVPAIERADRLQPTSKKRYTLAANQLAKAMTGYTVRDAAAFDVLEKVLTGIASTHGRGSATTARTVLTKYVLPRLVASRHIPANPLVGVTIDLPAKAGFTPKKAHLHTLTQDEWHTVVDHLLNRDTTGPLHADARQVKQSTITKHANLTTLTLIQATTGLRISEACALQWRDLIDEGDEAYIDLPAEKAKGKRRGRMIPLIHDGTTDYLRARRGADTDYIASAPSSPSIMWNPTNADDDVPELYRQVATATGVTTLETMTSHDWRATLNGIWGPIIGAETAAAIFGHSEAMNRKYYTDDKNISARMAAARSALNTAKGA